MNAMTLAVFAGFALALVAPSVHRAAPRAAGWLLAMLPAALAVYFVALLRGVAVGGAVRESRPWIAELGVDLAFAADGLSALFAAVISGVGAVIVVYSSGYLAGHPLLGRYYAYVLAFMAAMLGVALSDDLILLFVFWELTSVTSYLLIGFEHEKAGARASALQALLVTGGGGLALLAGFVCLGVLQGTFSISELARHPGALGRHDLYAPILLLVLAGAFSKSAQFPFHFWLPNAMAAPAPVSAYLHSATMVKAGVYLLARLTPVLGATELWSWLLSAAGTVTLLLGAWLALRQDDLKLLLAYSTLSVLGTLTLLLGIGSALALTAFVALFVAHAAYKGALFLVAGIVDHEAGTRDVARLAGLRRCMPLTAAIASVAALSMAGVPPSFGFVSKELLYEAVGEGSRLGAWGLGLAVASNVLLGAVALVVGLKPFLGAPPADVVGHEPPLVLWLGPALLAALGAASGLLSGPLSRWLAPGVEAALGRSVVVELSLWHGLNLTLLLSVATLALAVLTFFLRPLLVAVTARLEGVGRLGPERLYGEGIRALNAIARAQTRLLQSGSLRRYVALTMAAAVALTSLALFRSGAFAGAPEVGELRFHELVAAGIVLFGAAGAAGAKSRLAAVASLGAVGYGVALFYVLFGAPDLAITQFAAETLSVILFLLVVYRLPAFVRRTSRGSRLRDALVASASGALIALIYLAVTAVPHERRVSAWHAEHSLTLAQGRNVVNVTLVDFRALDTLGEITVLAVAAVGVFSLMRLRLGTEESR